MSSSLLHRKYLLLLCCLLKVSQYRLALIYTASIYIVKGISQHIHNIPPCYDCILDGAPQFPVLYCPCPRCPSPGCHVLLLRRCAWCLRRPSYLPPRLVPPVPPLFFTSPWKYKTNVKLLSLLVRRCVLLLSAFSLAVGHCRRSALPSPSIKTVFCSCVPTEKIKSLEPPHISSTPPGPRNALNWYSFLLLHTYVHV